MICGFGELSDEIRSKFIVTSPTKLIELRTSPAHYKYFIVDGNKKESKAMDVGKIIHMGVLEYEKFMEQFCTIPTVQDYSGKELIELCRKHELKTTGTKSEMTERILKVDPTFITYDMEMDRLVKEGKNVISKEQWDMVQIIRKKVLARKTSGNFIPNAKKECRGYCQINDQVIMTFCVDAWDEHNGKGILCDLKTSYDTSDYGVTRGNYREGRNLQMAAYAYCLNKITGLSFEEMSYLLFVETNAPYCVAEYLVDGAMMDSGKSEMNVLVKKLISCYEQDSWPDPQQEIEVTSLATWDWQKVLQDEEHML